jgi:hypothetical protein
MVSPSNHEGAWRDRTTRNGQTLIVVPVSPFSRRFR